MDKVINIGKQAIYFADQLEKNNEKKEIVVTNAGFYISHNTTINYNERNDNDDYLFLYQHKGSITISKTKQTLKDGCILFVPPNLPRKYTFGNEETNERYYIFFKGAKVKDILKQFGLDCENIYFFKHTGQNQKIINDCLTIIDDFSVHNFDNDIYRKTLLLNILYTLSQTFITTNCQSMIDIISPAIHYMELYYNQKLVIKDYANMCNISVSSLIRYFKQYTNTSPMDYLNNVKIKKAKYLLLNTTMSIKNIAISLGFLDPLYFSRFFRKKSNMSPQQYRDNNNNVQ